MKQLAALVLLCTTAFADPPVAKIIGPKTAHPGSIVILTIDGTPKHVKWQVDASAVDVPKDGAAEALEATAAVLRDAGYTVELPSSDEPQVYLVLDADQRRLLLSSYFGTYRTNLLVGDDEGVDMATHVVVVSGTLPIPVPVPVPIPIPTPTPTPTPIPVPTDFAAKLTAAVKAVPAAHAGFEKVANVYVLVADQVKSGLLTSPLQVTGFTSVMIPVAAGAHAAAWAEIDSKIIKPHLATLGLTTAAQHEGPWRQIAAAVKAGLTDIPPPVVVVDPPLPVTGLYVCVVEEKDDRSKLPASQVGIFSSTKLKGWLDQNGVKWRMFDADVDQSQLDDVWKQALKRVAESGQALPAIIVSNGAEGYIGPLPLSEDDTQTLVEKYK